MSWSRIIFYIFCSYSRSLRATSLLNTVFRRIIDGNLDPDSAHNQHIRFSNRYDVHCPGVAISISPDVVPYRRTYSITYYIASMLSGENQLLNWYLQIYSFTVARKYTCKLTYVSHKFRPIYRHLSCCSNSPYHRSCIGLWITSSLELLLSWIK